MSVGDLLAMNDARFLDVARGLSGGEWAAPSLCAEWSNREVLAHLVLGRSSRLAGLMAEMLRTRGSFDSANAQLASAFAASRSDAELVDGFARYSDGPRGIGRYFPRTLLLGDHVTHELDICFALDLEPTVAPAALVAVLNTQVHVPNPFVPAFRNSRGVRLVATDVGWVHGSGPDVVGSAAAIVSVLGDRPKALSRLTGEGVAVLAGRVSRPSRTAG